MEALYGSIPWEVLENFRDPVSFRRDVGGRFGLFMEEYQTLKVGLLQAFWESTHSFPIPTALRDSDPWFLQFWKERKTRRSHAGSAWKLLAWV